MHSFTCKGIARIVLILVLGFLEQHKHAILHDWKNWLFQDLSSQNMYDAGVALNGLACFVSSDLARDLANDIMTLVRVGEWCYIFLLQVSISLFNLLPLWIISNISMLIKTRNLCQVRLNVCCIKCINHLSTLSLDRTPSICYKYFSY